MEDITVDAINQSVIENDNSKTIQLCELYLKNISSPGKQSKEVEDVFVHYIHAMSNRAGFEKIKEMFEKLYSNISDSSCDVAVMYVNVLILNDKIEDAAIFSAHYLVQKQKLNELENESETIEKLICNLRAIKMDNSGYSQILELVDNLVNEALKEVEWDNEVKVQLENILNSQLNSTKSETDEVELDEQNLQVANISFFNEWSRKLWKSACSLIDYIKGIMRKPTSNEIIMIGVGAAAVIGGIYALRKMKK